MIEKPEDATIGGTDAASGVCAGVGIRFGAQRGEDFAFIFSSDEEVGVAALIQNGEREREAVRRHGLYVNGYDPAGFFLERGGIWKKRSGVALGS